MITQGPNNSHIQVSAVNATQATASQEQKTDSDPFWGEDGFDFHDIMDMINPMHHLPVVSQQYRALTKDEISGGSHLVGGVVFGGLTGGLLGVASSLLNAAVRHGTGKDMIGHATAFMGNDAPEAATGLAEDRQDLTAQATEIAAVTEQETLFPDEKFGESFPNWSTVEDAPFAPSIPSTQKPSSPLAAENPLQSLHPDEFLLADYKPVDTHREKLPHHKQQPEAQPLSHKHLEKRISETYGQQQEESTNEFWWEV